MASTSTIQPKFSLKKILYHPNEQPLQCRNIFKKFTSAVKIAIIMCSMITVQSWCSWSQNSGCGYPKMGIVTWLTYAYRDNVMYDCYLVPLFARRPLPTQKGSTVIDQPLSHHSDFVFSQGSLSCARQSLSTNTLYMIYRLIARSIAWSTSAASASEYL